MEAKRYTTHFYPGVGGAARYTSIDGTAMDVLKGANGVETRHRRTQMRYVGITAAAATAGVKPSRETASTETGALALSEQFPSSYAALSRDNRSRTH